MLSRGLLRSSSRLCRAVLSHSKRAPSAWQLPNTAPPLLSSASSIPIAPMAIARGFSSSSSSSADREQGLFSAADNEKFQFLEVSIKTDGVVVLKLHNPSQLNAMTIEMGREFEQVATRLYVESMNNNYNIRAVVITGAGSAFSAGGDLRFLRDRCSDAPLNNERLMLRFYSRFLSILKVQVPIIAAINGPAVGAGLCLACACDIRITAPQATLGLTFAKLGLHPGMGITHTLPQILGPEQAAKLLYTGGTFKGVDALEMGLVSQVSEDPLEAAIELANSMPDGRAVNSIVNTLRTQRVQGLDQMLQREAASQALCYSGPQFKTIIDSMIKKVKSEDSSTVTAPE